MISSPCLANNPILSRWDGISTPILEVRGSPSRHRALWSTTCSRQEMFAAFMPMWRTTTSASQRLCEKLGMRQEGVFKEFASFEKDGSGAPIFVNTIQYAILRKEWER